ncbi:hypothetical protein M0R45_004812 [Rubus argutus]|uniref:F-box domain-containing protein n=1 Tax=Rubus argutus TaxID=59490 RepID=A0AAW1YKU9_RUBAR
MAGEHLPEDIIVKILSNLPVKSLIRFRCVSKRWLSIVADPQFARLQFKVACEQQTLSRRFLFSSRATDQFESLDLELTSFEANSSIRKLDFPFPAHSYVSLLCSCNGLVCVGLDRGESFYIWNPSIGFIHRLPDPCFSSERRIWYYGFGYVSATDDYKLFVGVAADLVEVVQMFSLRARHWKKIDADPLYWNPVQRGVLLNETLHWLNWVARDYADLDSDGEDDGEPVLIAFDLAREEFWTNPVPFAAGEHKYRDAELGVSCDGCLHVICSPHRESLVSVEFWVMREYGKDDSWTKLYNLKSCNPPKQIRSLIPILVMQTCAIVMMRTDSGLEWVRIDHHEEKLGETSKVAATDSVPWIRYRMTGYEESLFWISDYLGVEETTVASNTRPHKAEIGEG